jgi:DNA (cytosine-5)-methyltransferase 1
MRRLLDLFCGGGGAAMGYSQAGFTIVGVDIHPQPHYPFAFVLADALEYLALYGQRFDVIHASPPCQAYSALKHLARTTHLALIKPVREALRATGRPYVIENVVGAPLDTTLLLCGSMFGLETPCGAQLRRHRLFESNVLLMSPGHCQHGMRTLVVNGHEFRNEATRWQERRATISVCGDTPHDPRLWRATQRGMKAATITITGSTPQQNVVRNTIRETFSVEDARHAMGIDWLGMRGLSQAIPPAYTHWIGTCLQQACAAGIPVWTRQRWDEEEPTT